MKLSIFFTIFSGCLVGSLAAMDLDDRAGALTPVEKMVDQIVLTPRTHDRLMGYVANQCSKAISGEQPEVVLQDLQVEKITHEVTNVDDTSAAEINLECRIPVDISKQARQLGGLTDERRASTIICFMKLTYQVTLTTTLRDGRTNKLVVEIPEADFLKLQSKS